MSDERSWEREQQEVPKYEHYQFQQPADSVTLSEEKRVPVRNRIHRRKKNSFLKKIGSTIVLGAVFGAVSGVVFQSIDLAADKYTKKTEVVTLEKAETSTLSSAAKDYAETSGMKLENSNDIF